MRTAPFTVNEFMEACHMMRLYMDSVRPSTALPSCRFKRMKTVLESMLYSNMEFSSTLREYCHDPTTESYGGRCMWLIRDSTLDDSTPCIITLERIYSVRCVFSRWQRFKTMIGARATDPSYALDINLVIKYNYKDITKVETIADKTIGVIEPRAVNATALSDKFRKANSIMEKIGNERIDRLSQINRH